MSSSAVLVNRLDPNAIAAWKLAIYLTESSFFEKVLYGDKDAIRMAFIMMEKPGIEVVEEIPYQVLQHDRTRRFIINRFQGRPFSVDQVCTC